MPDIDIIIKMSNTETSSDNQILKTHVDMKAIGNLLQYIVPIIADIHKGFNDQELLNFAEYNDPIPLKVCQMLIEGIYLFIQELNEETVKEFLNSSITIH